MIRWSATCLPRMFSPLALILVLCATPACAQGNDALYQQAKREKTVALYGAGPSDPYKRWIADFEKKYPGVTVAFTGGLSNTLDKKMMEGQQQGSGEDPMGRKTGGQPDFGDSVKVPGASEMERARDILKELRRRAAERGRPQQELDYIDRLLKQF